MHDKTIAKSGEFISNAAACVLALIDADGFPTAATITPSKTEGIERIYFGNHVDSNWSKRVGNCNRASICFNSVKPEVNITLVGTMEFVADDPGLKQEMWREWMEMYYSGPNDPKYCVLRFSTRRYSIYYEGYQIKGDI